MKTVFIILCLLWVVSRLGMLIWRCLAYRRRKRSPDWDPGSTFDMLVEASRQEDAARRRREEDGDRRMEAAKRRLEGERRTKENST